MGHLRNIFTTITAGALAIQFQGRFSHRKVKVLVSRLQSIGISASRAHAGLVCRWCKARAQARWQGSGPVGCWLWTSLQGRRAQDKCRGSGPKTSAEGAGPAAGLTGPSPDLSPPQPRVFNTPKLKAQLGPLRMICVVATECADALWPRGKKDQTPEPRLPSGKQRGGRCQFGTEGALQGGDPQTLPPPRVIGHGLPDKASAGRSPSWCFPLSLRFLQQVWGCTGLCRPYVCPS